MQARGDHSTQQPRPGHRRQRQPPRSGLADGYLAGQRIGGWREPGRLGPSACVIAVNLPPGDRGAASKPPPAASTRRPGLRPPTAASTAATPASAAPASPNRDARRPAVRSTARRTGSPGRGASTRSAAAPPAATTVLTAACVANLRARLAGVPSSATNRRASAAHADWDVITSPWLVAATIPVASAWSGPGLGSRPGPKLVSAEAANASAAVRSTVSPGVLRPSLRAPTHHDSPHSSDSPPKRDHARFDHADPCAYVPVPGPRAAPGYVCPDDRP